MFFAEHFEKHVLLCGDGQTQEQTVDKMFFAVERRLFGLERRFLP